MQIFVHQTQYKYGHLAGRYEFATISELMDEETECIVFLQQPLDTAFRTGRKDGHGHHQPPPSTKLTL
jgi:hypothetical protein